MGLAISSCSRQVEETSQLLISIPRSISKVITLSAPQLKHVVINVTGPNLANPVFVEWNANRPGPHCTADAVCQISVSRGNDRLIQVLTVYEDATGVQSFQYGDALKSLAAPEESIALTTAVIGSGSDEDVSIQGRYLTTATTGPTGLLKVHYRPAGKPTMVLGHEEMVNGWFRTFSTSGLKLEYMLDGQLLFGGAQALEDFRKPASVNVLEMRWPTLYWENFGSSERRKNPASRRIMGFFGPGATANHKVCYSTTAGNLSSAYSAATGGSLVSYDPTSTSASVIRVQVNAGRSNDCAGLTQFVQQLTFNPLLDSDLGMRGIFQRQALGRLISITGAGASTTATWAVLPGVETAIQNFHLFLILNGNIDPYRTGSHGQVNCKERYDRRFNGDGNAVYLGQTPGATPSIIIGSQATSSSQLLICLESQNRILEISEMDSAWSWSPSSSTSTSSTTSTSFTGSSTTFTSTSSTFTSTSSTFTSTSSSSTTFTSSSTTSTTIFGSLNSFSAPPYSQTTSINLSLSWTNLMEVYLTNTPGCASGGTWTTISASMPWTLPNINASSTIYAKGRTASLNETSCQSTVTTHDNVPPTIPIGVMDGDDSWKTDQSPVLTWSPSADTGAGLAFYEVSLGTSPGAINVMGWQNVGTSLSYTATGLSLTRGTTYSANVRAVDAAGNISGHSSGDGWVVNQELWVPNGSVEVMEKVGRILYLGGTFTQFGPWTGGATPINLVSGSYSWSAFPAKVSGTVYATIPDGSGGYYIGGRFLSVGGVPRKNLARINSDGSVHPLNLIVDNDVNALALSGSNLFVGGLFANVGGQSRSKLARIDTTSNTVTSWAPGFTGSSVKALAVVGSSLYVGGSFSNLAGLARTNLGAVDVSSGSGDSTFNASMTGSVVSALLYNGSHLYVGGNFTFIGGSSRNHLAALDVSTGLASGFNASLNGSVNALASQGMGIYIGGVFTNAGGQSRNRVACIDTSTGNAYNWNPVLVGAPLSVRSIRVIGSTVYLGGSFTTVNGQPRNNVASIDDNLGTTTNAWDPNANGIVHAMTEVGSSMIVAGDVSTFGGITRNKLAAIDLGTGMPTSWNPNVVGGNVYTLATNGSTIYVGGDFAQLGGQTRNNIGAVQVNGTLDSSFNPNADGTVWSLALNGSNLIVGGNFTTVSGMTRSNLVAVNTGTGIPTSWDPGANAAVTELALYGQKLYVVGAYTNIAGSARESLSAFDLSSGTLLAWNPMPSTAVMTMTMVGSRLWVGGSFTNIASQPRLRVAAFDMDTDSITSIAVDTDGDVEDLSSDGVDVLVTGAFGLIGGQSRPKIARFDSATGGISAWNAMPTGGLATSLKAFAVGNAVYIHGMFSTLGFGPPNLQPVNTTSGQMLPGP